VAVDDSTKILTGRILLSVSGSGLVKRAKAIGDCPTVALSRCKRAKALDDTGKMGL